MRERTSQIDIGGAKCNEVFAPFADGFSYCDAIYKCDKNGDYSCLWKKLDEKIVYPWILKVIKTARAWYPVVYYNTAREEQSLSYKGEKVVTYADKEGFFVTERYIGGMQKYDLWFCGGFLILTNYGELASYAVISKDGKQMHDMHDIVIDGTESIGRDIFKGNPYSSKYKVTTSYIVQNHIVTDKLTARAFDGEMQCEDENGKFVLPIQNARVIVCALWFEDGILVIAEETDLTLRAHYFVNKIEQNVSFEHVGIVGFGTWLTGCMDYYYDKDKQKVYFMIAQFSINTIWGNVYIVSYDGENLITDLIVEGYDLVVPTAVSGICKEGEYFFFWINGDLYKTDNFAEIENVDLGVTTTINRTVQTVLYDDEKYKCITSEYSEAGRRYEGYIYTFSNNFAKFEKEILGIKVPENSVGHGWY